MGNSTSSSNSAPCASVKVTTHRSKAHSIASLTGTSDSSTDSAPSSSLSTDQSGPSSGHSSTDDDAAELVYYSTQHESTQPHSCSSDSLSVDLEYFDRRSVDVTTSSFELVAPCPELRYNCSQVRQSLMPQYRSHSVLGLNEQLSTDSASLSTNSSVTNRHYVRQLTTKERFRESNERYGSKDQPGGIRVPVMPLPRSKSFHQILRPTQNGHILASKGTIRGASSTHSKTTTTTTKEPFVSRMKNMFNQKSKDFLSSQKVRSSHFDALH